MNRIESSFLGILLALTTAIGCIGYEKIVKNSSYFTVGILCSLSYIPFWISALYFQQTIKEDLKNLSHIKIYVIIFLLSGITGPLWYKITRFQTVMIGALYEVKFILVLAIIYILFGQQKFTFNTGMGIIMATLSVWFISKK